MGHLTPAPLHICVYLSITEIEKYISSFRHHDAKKKQQQQHTELHNLDTFYFGHYAHSIGHVISSKNVYLLEISKDFFKKLIF